jgi:hypothetical protein
MTAKNNKIIKVTSVVMIAIALIMLFQIFYSGANSSTGYEILGDSLENQSADISQSPATIENNATENVYETSLETNETSQTANETEIITVLNETQPMETNETLQESNITLEENMSYNETSQNQTLIEENASSSTNETNITANETQGNETYEINVTQNATETNKTTRDLRLSLNVPQRITRGVEFEVNATVSNADSLTAENVTLDWSLPLGFTIIAGDQSDLCGTIEPGFSCISKLSVKAETTAVLGPEKIKVLVNYG